MNFGKKVLMLAISLSCSVLAKSFDLRQRNLAPIIQEWVKEAKEKGTYDSLPTLIKEVASNMENGNFIVADLKTLKEVAEYTTDYLSTKYRRQLR